MPAVIAIASAPPNVGLLGLLSRWRRGTTIAVYWTGLRARSAAKERWPNPPPARCMALAMHYVVVEANMHRFTLLAAVAAVRLAAGCFGTVGYSASVSSGGGGPDLVYAAPGVQVIADYNEPIFFSDSLYWRFDGVRWYRSAYYTGGWVYATPPPAVRRIERPHDFVHYRPQGWVARRAPHQGPIARDHRGEAPRIERRSPTYAPPPSHAAPPPRAAPPPHAAPPQHDHPPASNDRDHRAPPKDDDRHDRHQEPR